MADLSAQEAIQRLCRTTGEPYKLVGRMPGGETGAHEVVGPAGRRVVAKWDVAPSSQAARRRAVLLTDRLRDQAGWPVPRQEAIESEGCLFVLQELMPGAPVERLTHALVDELIELHASRLGLERPEDRSPWPASLIETLTVGGDGYCLHEPLRRHSRQTARIVERVEAIGGALSPADLGGGDIVHWDLHPGNLLQVDGRLSAVIDNDFVSTGDAAFDLVTLALSALTVACEAGVAERLARIAIDPLDDVRRRAYLGHLLVRLLDWPIRRGRPQEVTFWIHQADRLLPP